MSIRKSLFIFTVPLVCVVILSSFLVTHAATTITDSENAAGILGHADATGNAIFASGGPNNGPNARGLNAPSDLAIDPADHRMFVADVNNDRVLVFPLDLNNRITTTTASYVLGQNDFVSNGTPASYNTSTFTYPSNVTYDAVNKRLFVADQEANRVLVFNVAPGTVANGENASYVLGQTTFSTAGADTTQSSFNFPGAMAFDPTTERLFVSDRNNNRIMIFDVAPADIFDGEPAAALLGQPNFSSPFGEPYGVAEPTGLALDIADERLFAGDFSDAYVRVYDVATSTMTSTESPEHYLGTPFQGTSQNQFNYNSPVGIAYDASTSRLFVSDYGNNRGMVFDAGTSTMMNSENALNVLGQADFFSNGPASSSIELQSPEGMAFDPTANDVFIADLGDNRIMAFDVATSTITDGENAVNEIGETDTSNNQTLSQNGPNDGPNSIGLNGPIGVAIDPVHHRAFVADQNNNRVLVFPLNANNTLSSTTARYVIGQQDFVSNVATTSNAGLFQPNGVAYDSNGDRLFIADSNNNRILVFNVASGTITNGETALHVLGQMDFFSNSPGTATNTLSYPTSITLDETNQRLFVADQNNNRILVFNVASGTIQDGENAAHVLGQSDFVSNNSNTSQDGLSSPAAVVYDPVGERLFEAERSNRRVLVFDADPGTMTDGELAVHVIGQMDFNSSNYAVSATGFGYPGGIAYDASDGFLFVSDLARLLVFPATSTLSDGESAVHVLGQANFSAEDYTPSQDTVIGTGGIAYDGSGDSVLFASDNGSRVMVFDFGSSTPSVPAISLSPTSLTYTATQGSSVSNQGTQSSVISDPGTAILNWSATSSAPWLALSSLSGTLSAGATTSIGLTVNPSSLSAGVYGATVTITSPGASNSPQTIAVNLTISAVSGGGGGSGPSVEIGGLPSNSSFAGVWVEQPASFSTESGVINILASFLSPTKVSSTWFAIDGTEMGTMGTTSPLIASFDTRSLSDGPHVFTVMAEDLYKDIAYSTPVYLNIKNHGVPAPSLIAPGTPQTASQTVTPTINFTSSPFMRNLKMGSTGGDVNALQKILITLNKGPAARALKDHGTTTVFGSLTFRALQEYQKAVGLPATGYFGPLTRAAIAS